MTERPMPPPYGPRKVCEGCGETVWWGPAVPHGEPVWWERATRIGVAEGDFRARSAFREHTPRRCQVARRRREEFPS